MISLNLVFFISCSRLRVNYIRILFSDYFDFRYNCIYSILHEMKDTGFRLIMSFIISYIVLVYSLNITETLKMNRAEPKYLFLSFIIVIWILWFKLKFFATLLALCPSFVHCFILTEPYYYLWQLAILFLKLTSSIDFFFLKYWVVQKVIAFFSFDFQMCLFNIRNEH